MKILTIIITLLAIGLIIFNATLIDLQAPLKGESMVAIITVLCSLCAILLLQILRMSKRISTIAKRR